MRMSRYDRRTVLKGIAAGGVLGLAGNASAGPPERCSLNWGRALSQRSTAGRPVINATQEVVNDIDSGFNGYWAYDDYRRLIRAWDAGDGTVNAVVMYNGQFDAVEGQNSPGREGGETLAGDEDGTLHGGYAATIEGTLVDDPEWPRFGFVGTTDYEGDVEDGTRPEAVDWVSDIYFEESTFAFDWWGWIYRGGACGTWVNAVGSPDGPGSCGDIICD